MKPLDLLMLPPYTRSRNRDDDRMEIGRLCGLADLTLELGIERGSYQVLVSITLSAWDTIRKSNCRQRS